MKELGKVYGLNGKEINMCYGINIATSVIPSDNSLTMSGVRLFEVTTDTTICDGCPDKEKCVIDKGEILKKTQSYLIKKKLYP
ncbi:MAG: hypothetical protein ABSF44_11910 [Candidatus Bathyarchaeia archaeon]